MKNRNLYIIGGLALAAGLAFLLLRKRKKDEIIVEAGVAEAPVVPALDTPKPVVGTPSAGLAAAAGFLTSYQDYTVETSRTGLNVRVRPDGGSRIVGSLPKGSTIKAKASGVKGWFEVSKDGVTPMGFVSSVFLRAKGK